MNIIDGLILYVKKTPQAMRPYDYELDIDMEDSIVQLDENGKPMGMVALTIGPDNEVDKWYITQQYFDEHYAPVDNSVDSGDMELPNAGDSGDNLSREVTLEGHVACALALLEPFEETNNHVSVALRRLRNIPL